MYSSNVRDRKIITSLFHASTQSGIKNFEVSKHANGEKDTPSAAIWLCSKITGAQYHVRFALTNKLISNTGYIYKLSINQKATLVDFKDADIHPGIFKKIKGFFPWHKRLLLKRHRWLTYLAEVGKCYEGEHVEILFKICKQMGVGAVLNPLVNELGQDWSEPAYGMSIAVLNEKVISVDKCYSYSDSDDNPIDM